MNDSTVVGECCFFGCVVCTKGFYFAINLDLCFEPLPTLGHSSIPTGVCRCKSSFLFWIHQFIVILIISMRWGKGGKDELFLFFILAAQVADCCTRIAEGSTHQISIS